MAQRGAVRERRGGEGVIALLAAALLAYGIASIEAAELPSLKKSLEEALRRQDFDGAARIVSEIAAQDTPQAADLVVETALKAPASSVYDACGNAFVGTQSGAVVDGLARRLKSRNAAEASFAAEALTRIRGFDEKRQKALTAAFLDLRNYPASEAVQAVLLPWLEANGSQLWALKALIDLRIQLAKRGISDGRLFHNVADALWKLTGQDYEKPAEWEKYWRIRAAQGERPEAGKPDGSGVPGAVEIPISKTAVVRKLPSFFGEEIRSSRALFVIDVSGSMDAVDPRQREKDEPEGEPDSSTVKTGRTAVAKAARKGSREEPDFGKPGERTRIQRVKRQLYRMIERYPDGRDFALITFGSKVEVVFAREQGGKLYPIPMNPATRKEALDKILTLEPSGLTRTDLAFETAFRFEGIDTIFLLSDGFPQKDPNFPKLPAAERRKVVNQLMRDIIEYVAKKNRIEGRRWEIHTFGFPEAMLGDFLQILARSNYGKYSAID